MPAGSGRFFRLFQTWFRPGFSADAAQSNAQVVRLALISEGINSWPLYVAQAKKFFEKEGARVEITVTGSSARQLEQLSRGTFDIGIQQSDHVVRAVEGGSDLFIFMSHSPAPEMSFVVAPGITEFAHLEGRVIAVDGARSGYALLLRKLLADKGLTEGDYVLRECGGSRERFEALESGIAAASLLNPPFDRNLFAAGFGHLGTTREYFPTYPGATCAARRSWAARNEKLLVAFIRGFRAACTWLQDAANKAEAIRILPARLNLTPEAAAKAFEAFGKRGLPELTADALAQVIDIVWEAEGYSGPKPGTQRYCDPGFLRKAGVV